LAQAEAIADLIEASSAQAARNALRSLQGAFSQRVHNLTEQLIGLRIYVEAAIDFPEEEIDFLADGHVLGMLDKVRDELSTVLREAGQGALLRDGMTVVIAGRPNAGKSSLLNALAGREAAIVTEIAGTTRDILREHIHIDGMPLHVVDTAGLRDTDDHVEKIGVERALKAISEADRVLLVVDATAPEADDPFALWPEFLEVRPDLQKLP
jgi:tRNA modification GTPase